MLSELNKLPSGLLELAAPELIKKLKGPTLIHLPGREQTTVFLSVLLHGNEPTGWEAVRRLLGEYVPGGGNKELPKNLSIFIGNIKAANKGLRRLDGQADFNRVWPGGNMESPETVMMQQVVDIMQKRNLFASIDIHNNTGINPHYGCINVIDNRFLRLALLFSRTVIYFTRPLGVQSLAFAKHCPAVTIEAGKVGDESGITHARNFIDDCLHLHELSAGPLHHEAVDLYHTVATVKIPPEVSFGFDNEERIIQFDVGLEKFNFSELAAGTVWGELFGNQVPLLVKSENGNLVTDKYFANIDGKLTNKVPIMPSMLTIDKRVIEQDCLCYLMERYSPSKC